MLRKRANRLLLGSIIFIIVMLNYVLNIADVATAKQTEAPIIRPSTIINEVRDRLKKQPNLSAKELAYYANQLLDYKGFNYEFDVCEIIGINQPKKLPIPPTVTYSHAMVQSDGENITLRFVSEDPGGAPCGECFSPIPSLQVTQQEMVVISEGKRYRLKRPDAFALDEAALVDTTMKKVLRMWQLPYQTVPIGISPDGTKLYLELQEQLLDAIVLELSEEGRLQFKVRNELDLQGKGEGIENHPKDPKNAYLSFIRFRAGGKSYIVKYSAPCT